MTKGVIFDVDGTLLDSMGIWEKAGERYLESLGISAEENLGQTLFPMSMAEGAAYLKKHYGLRQTKDEVVRGISREVENFYRNQAALKEGCRGFLEEIRRRNLPMVLVTSSERIHVEAALQRLGILCWFQEMLTCTEWKTNKRKPDIYRIAAAHMDARPEETVVFEDAYHAVKTAKEAGCTVIAVYDPASDPNLEKIKETADAYLPRYDFRKVEKWFAAGREEDENSIDDCRK